MQKGVFLVAMGGPETWKQLYEYKPYNWGPYSSELAIDLERLLENGFIRINPVKGSKYGAYVPTERGSTVASKRWASLERKQSDFLLATFKYITSRSFNRLLRDVYAAYPKYATESRFERN